MRLNGSYVLVKQDPSEQKVGMIIIPEIAQRQGMTGTVIAVGDGLYKRELKLSDDGVHVTYEMTRIPVDESIRPGTKVVFPSWAGQEFEYEGEKYLLLKAYDILATIEEG